MEIYIVIPKIKFLNGSTLTVKSNQMFTQKGKAFTDAKELSKDNNCKMIVLKSIGEVEYKENTIQIIE